MTMTMAPTIRAPRGSQLRCKGWQQEAALRCLMNNLDPEVAERPADLVVYGGIGKAARNWECFHAIVRELERLGHEETLLVQSGRPVAVFPTHEMAPRVIIANSNLVGKWATWEHFNELDRKGLMMYGQMTAGSWIYIGTQGILQGTFQTFAALADRHFGGSLRGRLVVTGGMGGMGGAQPLSVTLNGGVVLAIDVDRSRIERRVATRYCDTVTEDLDEALRLWPTAPGYLRAARTDTVLGGQYRMNEGDWALVFLPLLHRDPRVWPHAERFDPDRFGPGQAKSRPPHAYKPFGTGKRACIGRQFALHEAVLALGLILHRYRLTPPDAYELQIAESLTLKPRGFELVPCRRR